MKKIIKGYARMNDFKHIEKDFPPIIDEKDYVSLLNKGLWDKVKITIEINEE